MRPTKFDETHLRNLLLFSTKNQFVLWRQWKTVSVCSKLKLKRMVGNIVEINYRSESSDVVFWYFLLSKFFHLWIYASLIKRSCTQIVLPHSTRADVINCFSNFSNNELMSFLKSTPLEDEWYSLKMMKCQSPIVQI